MKKIIILAISLIGTLALTGCASTSTKVTGGCTGGSASSTQCSVGVTVSSEKSAGDPAFDANLVSIDLSQSNVSVISGNGTVTLSIKNTSGVTVASSVFNWYSVGDTLYPSNTAIMNNWVNTNLQAGYELIFDTNGIETTGDLGNNTFTAIFNYGSHSVGASDSFYLNDADLNRF